MEKENLSAIVVLGEPDYGLTRAYFTLLEGMGWHVTGEDCELDRDNFNIAIIGFETAADNLGLVEAIPTLKLAIDFQYKEEYESDDTLRPFHYLDNTTIIIHDLEAKRLIKEKIKPVDSRLIMFPYREEEVITAALTDAKPVAYTIKEFEDHPWLEGIEVSLLEGPFPDTVGRGSSVVIPKYDSAVWPLVRWAARSGLATVAPGIESFSQTLFYGALLFDPASEDDFRLKIKMLSRPPFAKPKADKLSVAVVVPRYIEHAAGGAERQAGDLAKAFGNAGHNAEIITTRSDSMGQWNNKLSGGEEQMGEVTIRRFEIDSSDPTEHHKMGHRINMRDDLTWTEETDWMRSSIRSTALDDYIEASSDRYDYLFFIPYLYGTSYWASQRAPEKSFLVPCYHNEAVAYMRPLKQNGQWVAGILFNTVSERRLAEKTLKVRNPTMIVAGEGVEVGATGDAKRFREKYGIQGDFLLYVGRFQPEKNLPSLIEDFAVYKANSESPITLVLIGKGDMKLKDDPDNGLKVLGYLPEQDKIDAYSACTAFALPSLKESFSIVMMESWIQGRPVIAHGMCAVSREHMFNCGGGALYTDADEFAAAVERITGDKARADEMGLKGREYVFDSFNWGKIVENLVDQLAEMDIEPLAQRLGAQAKACANNLDMGGGDAFARWVETMAQSGAEISISSELSLPEMVERLEDNADIRTKYREFSHRALFGQALSRLRGVMTRHLRANYIEPFESKQRIFNKETARLIQKLFEQIDKLR